MIHSSLKIFRSFPEKFVAVIDGLNSSATNYASLYSICRNESEEGYGKFMLGFHVLSKKKLKTQKSTRNLLSTNQILISS